VRGRIGRKERGEIVENRVVTGKGGKEGGGRMRGRGGSGRYEDRKRWRVGGSKEKWAGGGGETGMM